MSNGVSFAPRRRTVSPMLGGILALTYPSFLIAVSLSVGFRRAGDMGDFAATMAGSLLFVIAAPTAWVLSFSFIDVTRFTVLVFGVATSFPVWYLVGAGIARGSESWLAWFRRYAIGAVAWTALNLIAIAAVASFAS